MRKLLGLTLTSLISIFGASLWAATGMANLSGTVEDSEVSGLIKFEDVKEGLKVSGTIENVSPGEHGFHIHDFGDCGNEGKNAGGHYNPGQKPHGDVLKNGPSRVHPGDLGNVMINDEGKGEINVLIPGVHLMNGKYVVAGRAVILHDKKDDFGQPTGNAGGRIGCGPIVLTEK